LKGAGRGKIRKGPAEMRRKEGGDGTFVMSEGCIGSWGKGNHHIDRNEKAGRAISGGKNTTCDAFNKDVREYRRTAIMRKKRWGTQNGIAGREGWQRESARRGIEPAGQQRQKTDSLGADKAKSGERPTLFFRGKKGVISWEDQTGWGGGAGHDQKKGT